VYFTSVNQVENITELIDVETGLKHVYPLSLYVLFHVQKF